MSDESNKIDSFRQRFGNKPSVRRDEEAMERRRKNVWEMYSEHVPQTAMANILGVSRVTIASDIDVMEKRAQTYASDLKDNPEAIAMDIGLTVKKLDTIAAKAMAEYAAAESAQDKDRFLNTAQRAIMNRNRVLIETGYLPKAGIEVKQTTQHIVSFEERFGKYKIMDNATARRKVLAVAEAALKLGLSNTVEGNVIDAEAKVVDNSNDPPKSQT